MKQFIVGILLLAYEGQVIAGCGTFCRPSTFRKKPVIVEKVVEEAVFIKFNPVLLAIQTVELPTYSSYVVPVVPQQVLAPIPTAPIPPAYPSSPQNAGLGRIEAMLSGMSTKLDSLTASHVSFDARLKKLEAGVPSLPPPIDPPEVGTSKPSEGRRVGTGLDAMGIYNRSCVSCHMKGKEKDHGNFVLLTDVRTRAVLTGKQFRAMTKHLTQGTMPPKDQAQLTDQEASVLVEDLSNFEVR